MVEAVEVLEMLDGLLFVKRKGVNFGGCGGWDSGE